MLERFPSWGTMIAFDVVFVTVALVSTVFVFRHFRQLRRIGAQKGTVLILAGTWAIAGLYVTDLSTMVLLPSIIGMEKSMMLMYDTHVSYAWYVTFFAQVLMVAGLILVVSKLLGQHGRVEKAAEQLRTEVEDRAVVESELRESENRYANAVEIARLGHYVWDTLEDRCIYCSDMHAAFHGMTPEEYIKRASSIDGEFALTADDDRERVRENYRRLKAGEPIEMEYGVFHGTRELRMREIAKPIFDDKNVVIREVGTTLDITELFVAEQRLAHSQRLETIGHLAGGVAHDFNNLLYVVLGNLELAQAKLESGDVRDKVDTAVGAAKRGAELTKNLLSFAGKARLEPKTLDLNQIVVSAGALAKRVLPSSIDVEAQLSDDLWDLAADPNSLENAILNLVLNARDAMPDGGTITVRTENYTAAKENNEELEPGKYVTLVISDTGHGIDNTDLEEVFTPFFTTKPTGTGSGLGLSMVQGFVHQSGGAIKVCSEPGVGTTFSLYFQVAAREAPVAALETVTPPAKASSGAKLLVAEDDQGVLEVIATTLDKAGYFVLTASSGSEALEKFKSNAPIDALITDIVMPGEIQGTELARNLRQSSPDLPIVFLSGYSSDKTEAGNGFNPPETRLMKPVDRHSLVQAVENALLQRGQTANRPEMRAASGL